MTIIDPLVTDQLKEFDKLVRSYAKYPDKACDYWERGLSEEELDRRQKEYSQYCRRKAGHEDGDRFEGLSESVLRYVKYKEMRESISQCLDMWSTIIRGGHDDVQLFTL